MLKVKHLIGILKDWPQDAVISVDAENGLISDNLTMNLVDVSLNVDKDDGYYSKHEIIKNDSHAKDGCSCDKRLHISHVKRPPNLKEPFNNSELKK